MQIRCALQATAKARATHLANPLAHLQAPRRHRPIVQPMHRATPRDATSIRRSTRRSNRTKAANIATTTATRHVATKRAASLVATCNARIIASPDRGSGV